MTKIERIESFLEYLLVFFRLQSWVVTLHILNAATYEETVGLDFKFETNGCTNIDGTNKIANIFIPDNLTDVDLRRTLIHECIHLVTHSYDSFIQDTIETFVPKKYRKPLETDALWEMEISVEGWVAIFDPLISVIPSDEEVILNG